MTQKIILRGFASKEDKLKGINVIWEAEAYSPDEIDRVIYINQPRGVYVAYYYGDGRLITGWFTYHQARVYLGGSFWGS